MSTAATSVARPAVSPVQDLLDDLMTRFPHDEGEGRFPVPGDYQDANGEWMDIPNIFKVIGFIACYSDADNADCIEMGEPFMKADYVRDTTGAPVVVDDQADAEAFRRYAGVHPKVTQDLMRHSSINLTMNIYTHTALESRLDAVEILPDTSGQHIENKDDTAVANKQA